MQGMLHSLFWAAVALSSAHVAARAGYVHHRGFIPLGDDCFNASAATTTLAAALQRCSDSACCAAFTYRGNASGPADGTVTVYFKNATGARSFMGNLTSDWITFLQAGGPCDILNDAVPPTPCVAAHSLTRPLYGNYTGPLYAVKRASDDRERNISVLPGNVADAPGQDEFCATTSCTVTRIFDQSPQGNHLDIAPAGGHVPRADRGVNASRAAVSIGGSPVFAAYFEGGQGYRIDNTSGVATGNEEETIYMVTSGQHFNAGCCFVRHSARVALRLCVLRSSPLPNPRRCAVGLWQCRNQQSRRWHWYNGSSVLGQQQDMGQGKWARPVGDGGEMKTTSCALVNGRLTLKLATPGSRERAVGRGATRYTEQYRPQLPVCDRDGKGWGARFRAQSRRCHTGALADHVERTAASGGKERHGLPADAKARGHYTWHRW